MTKVELEQTSLPLCADCKQRPVAHEFWVRCEQCNTASGSSVGSGTAVKVTLEQPKPARDYGEPCYKTGNCQCGNPNHPYEKPVADKNTDELKLGAGERSLAKAEDGKSYLVGITMSDVPLIGMKYLWPGRIPLGKGMVAQGMPGKGKSMAVLSIAACITTGADFPDGAKNELGARTVLWAGTEDDLSDTVKPRLQAAGADMSRMIAMKRVCAIEDGGRGQSRNIRLQKDLSLLTKLLRENPDIVLVIFDPITGFYGGADGNSHKEIRPMMEGLAEVCMKTGVTVIAIMHENRRKDVSALERVLGASAVGHVFRAAFRFSDDAKNKGAYIMACSKTTFKIRGGLRYTIQDAEVTLDDGTVAKEIGKVVWGEVHDLTADDVLQQAAEVEKEGTGGESGETGKAKTLLQSLLADGAWHLCSELHREREKAGITDITWRRASYSLNVNRKGIQPGPFHWQLPAPDSLPVGAWKPNAEGVLIPDGEL